MRVFFLKGLLILAMVPVGAACAFAAMDAGNATPAKAVTAVSQSTSLASSTTKETTPTSGTETVKVAIVAQPAQVAMVSGDYHKYEAMTWQNRGYSGGIKDLDINYTSGDDVTIDAGGSGIIGNGDYKGYYSLKNKDVGYVDVDYKQFRKYYDTYGGIWQGWSPSLSRDLYLDIGHFGIEAGITMPDLPNVSVYYDHDYKDGSKSTLDWGAAVAGFTTKKICPAWKEIKETTDTFGIKADHTHNGYHLTGDQRWEITKDKTLNVEPLVISNGSNTPGNETRQYYTADTTLMTTMLGADKWFLDDKVFTSSAYRFMHLKNDQVGKTLQFNSGGAYNSTATSAFPNSDGNNVQDVNSWVLNMMVSPWSWLSGTGGIKAEVNSRDGLSRYPNGTGTNNLEGDANSNTFKIAETAGLRFRAIPRTTIYSDLSFEQSQNHLVVRQFQTVGTTAGAVAQNRDAIVDEPTITWATGADFQPVRFVNLTSQFRLQDKSMNFHDNPVRSTPWQGQVFLEKLNSHNLGFTQRATVKLSGWAQTSFRYLFDNTDFDTRQLWDTADSKAKVMSNNFIYDLSVYPMSNLSMTGSFSQLYSQTKTVQSSRAVDSWLEAPFTSNSSTWMLATDYQPHKKVSLNSSLFYTLANNYQSNQSNVWQNYEAAFDQLGLNVSCKWDVNKDLSVTPQYGYQRYLPNERSGIGGAYDAQIISVAITQAWG